MSTGLSVEGFIPFLISITVSAPLAFAFGGFALATNTVIINNLSAVYARFNHIGYYTTCGLSIWPV
ncbi:hypothetical protein B0H13DRAFT_2376002 [Mycena leptocephala]|nr:hypothetical protein B0H13DRAFT_2376002 [Mycena leptocephala]